MGDSTSAYFEESAETIRQTRQRLARRIAQAVEVIVAAFRAGGRLLVFGNGGSAADAQHMAAELVGRYLKDRPPLDAQALTTDTSTLTSLANDYGFESVFARQVEAAGRKGDVAVGISTSGDSANVAAALAKARELGMKTVALTGEGGGKCACVADILLDVPSKATPHVQEAHAVIYHAICQGVEEELFGDA